MLSEDIQKLRKELSCTGRELALTLGVDPKEVAAWETGERFPTKRQVDALLALREKGPSSVLRQPRGKTSGKVGTSRLADPTLWKIVRKLLEHPALFDQVSKLSETYPDPAEPG